MADPGFKPWKSVSKLMLLTTTPCYLVDLKGRIQRKIILAKGGQGGEETVLYRILKKKSLKYIYKKTNSHFYWGLYTCT